MATDNDDYRIDNNDKDPRKRSIDNGPSTDTHYTNVDGNNNNNTHLDLGGDFAEEVCALCRQSIKRGEGSKVSGYLLHFSCAGNLIQAISNETATKKASLVPSSGPDRYSMGDLKEGDHIVLGYSDQLQLQFAVSEFVKKGVEKGRISILFLAERDAEKYTAYLKEGGVDVDSLTDSQDVVILLNDELLGKSAGVIHEKLATEIKSFGDAAKERGRRGIGLWSETAGLLTARGRYKDCILLERLWEEDISRSTSYGMPITAVCPYSFIPPRIEVALSEFHNQSLVMTNALRLTKLQYGT